MSWDNNQKLVIEAPTDARLLVQAGPGKGKTAVACARVAHLIREGVPPAGILLISFTRTAVAEMRKRIAAELQGVRGAGAVEIVTIDRLAWHLREPLQRSGPPGETADFEANIHGLLNLFDDNSPELLEFVARYSHVLVDEAQDVMGARAELVTTLIHELSRHCGVTVFGDAAQSIYGFTADDELNLDGEGAETLLGRLASELPNFQKAELTTLYRTASPGLKKLLTEGREKVLDVRRPSTDRLLEVRDAVLAHCDGTVDSAEVALADGCNDQTLVLYRSRLEVLMASSFLSNQGIEHRLRMPNLQPRIQPWIGWLFSTTTARVISRAQFGDLWKSRVGGLDPDACFQQLAAMAPGPKSATLDLEALRTVLARPRPPLELCDPEVGTYGPILGTIHASKGREADQVLLYVPRLPKVLDDSASTAEEARVLFVAASRARKELFCGKGSAAGSKKLSKSGRRWRNGKGKCQVEFGLAGDVSDVSAVAANRPPHEIEAAQRFLAEAADRTVTMQADRLGKDECWEYELRTGDLDEQHIVGRLARRVQYDLLDLANLVGGKVLGHIAHLYLHGATTVAIPPNDPRLAQIAEPWATSGFFLAPMIKGFTVAVLPR